MSSFVDYVKGSFREFRYNVEFPSWKDLSSSTMVVAVATLILAIFLFGIDELFSKLMYQIYTGLSKLIQG